MPFKAASRRIYQFEIVHIGRGFQEAFADTFHQLAFLLLLLVTFIILELIFHPFQAVEVIQVPISAQCFDELAINFHGSAFFLLGCEVPTLLLVLIAKPPNVILKYGLVQTDPVLLTLHMLLIVLVVSLADRAILLLAAGLRLQLEYYQMYDIRNLGECLCDPTLMVFDNAFLAVGIIGGYPEGRRVKSAIVVEGR